MNNITVHCQKAELISTILTHHTSQVLEAKNVVQTVSVRVISSQLAAVTNTCNPSFS